MTRHVLTCLWAGHDLPGYSANKYGVIDVLNLWLGVHRHVTGGHLTVLADDEHVAKLTGEAMQLASRQLTVDERAALPHTLHIRPLQGYGKRHGGWSHVLEAFNPDLLRALGGNRFLVVGLDTLFVRNSDWLFDWDTSPVGLPADPYNLAGPPCDAVVTYSKAGADDVWAEFMHANGSVTWPYPYAGGRASEMVLLQSLYDRRQWAKIEGPTMGRLASYKALVRPYGLPERCSVVYFHGHPKPQEMPLGDPLWQHML